MGGWDSRRQGAGRSPSGPGCSLSHTVWMLGALGNLDMAPPQGSDGSILTVMLASPWFVPPTRVGFSSGFLCSMSELGLDT